MTKIIQFLLVVQLLFTRTSGERYSFPDGFIWSLATSSYQIEGGAQADGRGPSIWDTYSHLPNKIKNNDTTDVTCDSYRLYPVDVANLKWIGATHYQISISWSRILPNGRLDSRNQNGIDYYNRLFDALLMEGIQPMVSLYHWDLPQALQDRGGWLNSEIAAWYSEYARLCFMEFGTKVKYWITFTEPRTHLVDGYCGDANHEKAPGGFEKHCAWTMYWTGHLMLLAHAMAFRLYEKEFMDQQKGKIGIMNIAWWYEPKNPDQVDHQAAASRDFEMNFGWFSNPIFSENGDYPDIMKQRIAEQSMKEGRAISRLPQFSAKEIALIKGSAHFLGLNYYSARTSRPWISEAIDGLPAKQINYDSGTVTEIVTDWPNIGPPGSWLQHYPDGLRKILLYIKTNYNNILTIITESGAMDQPGEEMNDTTRIAYLNEHMKVVAKAIRDDKINVAGYTIWSIMDNFESADGFSTKFGIFRTDFDSENKTRTPKQSAYWLKNVTAENAVDDLWCTMEFCSK